MIKLFKYNLDGNYLQRSHSYELFKKEDERYTTMINVISKYKDVYDDIAFIECDSLILKCLQYIKTSKFSQSYDKVILWASELYWDSCDDGDYINKLLDDNVHIIFNFFRKDSPFNLKSKSYCSIGSFGDITQMYLNQYHFDMDIDKKYNLISKFGRPNPHRMEIYNELKDLPNIIYSINNFDGYEDEGYTFKGITFESEKKKKGDFKSNSLPDEDFESFAECITETRLSQFEESNRLISATEKTLKGFMFKRPNITFVQPEVFSYLENFGFQFPNYFGLDSKKEQLEICKEITLLSKEKCKEITLQHKDVFENNYNTLLKFLEHHRNKFDDIISEIIYDN